MTSFDIASVNGVELNTAQERLTREELRQRACTELLRQAAQRDGLLEAADAPTPDGVISERAAGAIDALIERSLDLPEPTEEACRRHHAAHRRAWRSGERVRMRHILFAVTPGVDVAALRKRAESILLDVRCHDGRAGDGFADAARRCSNCPSGEQGGELGWLEAGDCAPEFARELFGRIEVGVLPRLVHSRFGLHVVEVLERHPGVALPYEAVSGAVAAALRRQTFAAALRQYLLVLAGEADVRGVDLGAAPTPLVR